MMSPDSQRLAYCFRKLGWMCVWFQAVLAIIPLAMLAYVLLGRATGSRPSLSFMDYLALVGLAILAFTTFWSYRYTRLAKRIADPDRAPLQTSLERTLWVGLWAGCLGIALSLLLLVVEVGRLLFLLLKAPQGGVPVMRTQIEGRDAWVSAMDIVTLLAELCTLAGELVVIGFTLWLLFAVTRRPEASAESTLPGVASASS